MQASPNSQDAGGGYATRRGHVPQLSISDPSHHVTEAIGHMYDDDYDKRDSRRLSYVSSPLSESITIVPQNRTASGLSSSSQSLQPPSHADGNNYRLANGQSRPSTSDAKLQDRIPASPGSTTPPASADTATTSFPLNNIDYESNPAAVAQELNNLAAIRRMSMDVTATGDPDLPSFNNFPVPSIAPSPSDDENDTSRLFWVPARLHPELAPKEFKSFLESKAEHIKRRSGDFSSLSPDRQGSNGSLRRKRSMLSRQIDNAHGYTDGAERLERKRSQNKDPQGPNLQELGSMVDDSKSRIPSASSILESVQSLGISTDEDKPILPPAPPGHSLRRSTRTQYRKAGSLKKGERPPYSKRVGRSTTTNNTTESIVSSSGSEPILGLTRVSTDPTPSATRARTQGSVLASSDSTNATSSSMVDHSQQAKEGVHAAPFNDSGSRASAPQQSTQWHSPVSSNERPSPMGQTDQRIPEIVETPPSEAHETTSTANPPSTHIPARASNHDVSLQSKGSGIQDVKRPLTSRTHAKETVPTLNEFANNPQPLPGNTTRTDSLSFIPTLPEDRKTETKKTKEKKESESGRKSSWHWLLGSEDKEKEKKKDSDSKKTKTKIVDKLHDATHAAPASNEISQRRESAVFDRLDPKLEEERKKDNARRSSGESKKEKESGLFSSIFGGARKKNSEHHHKKSLSRTLSPDPPVRELRPDIDYPWTRFSILEERAIYRMAHIKLANPRRALHSQVLLSNFMYSYLAKVQQMHPHMTLASSASQRQQNTRDQPEEYLQYQRYQEAQDQHQYGDSSYDDSQMYDYSDDPHSHYQQHSRGTEHHGYENGNAYGPGHHQYSFGDDAQLDDDVDDMWYRD